MIPAIQEIGFGPGTEKSYATLHQATISFAEMGERTISTQVRIDGDVVPDFSGWELSFKGERFILNTKEPQAAKDNSTRNSLVDLTFVSWVVNELKRYFFFEPTSIDSSTAIADKYNAPVNVPVEDFAVLFNKVLDYYFDGKVVFSLYMSGQGQYSTDRALVEINYTYIWDVLVKFFEIYGVRWRIEYDSTNDIYTIKAGWPTTEIDINDHDFEYGYQGGLLRFERQVQDVNIHNILLGRGGEKNIPYRYFKRIDPQNPDWAADPDAIPELSNIYFDRLRDINFRWYVRGWMQNPNHDTSWEDDGYEYPIYPIDSDSPYYFAYLKGLTDDKFNPVEYVKDDESIADYGEHWGALDDNDDIFPTIQGVTRAPIGRIDEAVAVSEIVTDDISAMAQNAAIEKSINRMTISLDGDTRTAFDIQSEEFTIPSGSTGNVTYVPVGTDDVNPGLVRFDTDNSSVVAVSDGTEYPIDAIPAGTYRLKLHLVIARSGQASSATGTFGIENIVLTTSTMDTDAWKPTFDIWVKNIWGTTKEDGENDIQYAERVWLPILGDRAGNEAKVVFSSGFMSVSEDYEFTIASYPVYDTSKSINGVPSEWRITLRKSDAEFDATGLYIPNASTGGQPVAGDKFFFIGIDMPHAYVTLAEEDLNTNKTAQLDTEAAISPTWIMNLDKVRVHTLEDQEYGRTLADRLAAGGKVWIKDKRFTPGTRLQLYVQSITYTWNEPTNESPYIVPDIEVVLSDKVVAVDSVVQRIQNDVSSIKNQYARISDVEAVVRSVAEPIFLKKTGESDSSDSPTQFSSKVTSKGFRQGAIGGTGWGIYRDNTKSFAPNENEQASPTRGARSLRSTRALLAEQEQEEADAVIEADRIVVRKELQVNSLVINQIAYIGGKEIISAAKIEVSKVIETADSYICYFDQRRNSVANNFAVNDIAFGQVFNPDNTEQRYYKMVVTATDVDCITLGKTPNDGSGVPKVGDIIVQYGNTTNASRQYVIVRDVIGGGYERMLSGLSTVSSTGKEYYFAGRQGNAGPRWFVGDSLGDYAEYENGVLTIKANVIFKAGQEIPGLSALETQVDNLEYLHDALPKSDTIVNGGLILSKVIALRDALDNIKSGINGDPSLSSIAAWYGGPMADKEASPTPASYAKSLFRFDGSGYLAGGNIRWNEQGYGSIPGVSWDNGEIRISGDVKLTSVGDNTVTSLLTAVQNMPSTYVTIATAQTVSGFKTFTGGIQIGDATITWVDGENGNPGYLRIDQALLTVGDQIVLDGSPGGGGGGGGGSSYLRDLLDVSVSSRSNGDILRYNGSVWVNTAPSQLPVATGTTNGLMSSSDYSKLAGIAAGATAVNESTVSGWGFTKNAGTVTGVKREGDVNPYSPNASGIVTIPAYPTTLPNPNALTFGNKTYNGSAVAEITAADLGAFTSHQPIYNLVIKSSAGATQLTYRPATNGTYELQLTSGMVGLEYVDNLAAADYFTALTSGSSDLLSITIGGTTKKLTTLYASRLTTVSKTAWGQTYWTANGIPANISGNMSSVGNITPSANNSKNLGSSALSWNNLYVKRVYLTGSVYFEYDTNGSYVKLNAPLVTDGDQIVISGTPGGGGGGGATTLQGLDDTNINSPSSTQVLQYLNGKWTNVNSTEVGVTSVKIGNTSYNPTSGVVSLPAYAFGTAGSDYVPITIGTTTKNVLTAHQSLSDYLTKTLAASTYVTNVLVPSGSNVLRVVKNGVNTDLTIPYAECTGINGINTEADIKQSHIRGYRGGGANWTGSISSMAYAAILALGSYSRGWQMWAARGDTALYWRNGNQDADAWNNPRIIYDSATLTKSVVTGLIGDETYHPYGGGNIAFQASTLTTTENIKLQGADRAILMGASGSEKYVLRRNSAYLTLGSGTYESEATVLYGTPLRFYTYNGTSGAERMRILANGNVGIGSTNPSALLYVNGTTYLNGNTTIPSGKSLQIGDAVISWNTNGYLQISKPLVTNGDQIVISGTPGGGGGGGATTLAGLDDTNISNPSATQVLQYVSGKWTNVDASSVGRIYSPGTGISISPTNAISLSATYAGGTAVTLNGQSKAASTASFYAPAAAGTTGQILKATTNGAPVWTSSALGDTNKPVYLNSSGVLTEGVSCLPLTGGYIQSASGNNRLRITTDGSANHIQSWASNTASANLNISGYNGNAGRNLYLKFDNVYAWDGSVHRAVYHAGNLTKAVVTGLIGSTTYAEYNANGYLPLNGGTLTGEVELSHTVTNGACIKYTNKRATTTGSGWGDVVLNIVDADGAAMSRIGIYGSANTLNYVYIGSAGATGDNLRISSTGLSWGSNTVWHANNSNKSNVAWTCSTLTANGVISAKGADQVVLSLARTDNNYTAIEFLGKVDGTTDTALGRIGYNTAGAWVRDAADTAYRYIWHTGNSNLSTVDWTTKALNVNGRLYMKGGNAIEFDNASGTTRGMLSATDSKELQWHDGSWRTVYHSNNANLSTVDWSVKDLTASGNIYLPNAGYLYGKSTTGTNLGMMAISSSNNLAIGYGLIGVGNTNIYGDSITLRAGGTSSIVDVESTGINPHTTDTSTLGTSSLRWSNIYGNDMELIKDGGNASITLRGISKANAAGGSIYFYSRSNKYNGFRIGTAGASYDRQSLVFYISGTGAGEYISNTWTQAMRIHYDGKVKIGTGTPSQALDVTGSILSSGDQVVSSDITKKTNLVPIDLKVEQIAGAPAVTFDWKTGGHSFGSIAQYWKDVLGEAVLGDEGNYALAYGQLALVNTIIEAREIDKLKARVAELEAEVKRLRMN